MKKVIQIVCVVAASVAFGVGQAAVRANPGDMLLSIPNPEPSENANFGYSVAAVGGNILVGCPYDDTGARDAGAAYLFDGSTGELLLKFPNPTPAEDDSFGWSVAAVGNNVLIGAYLDDTEAPDAGAAYLLGGSTGELLLTVVKPGSYGSEWLGYDVAAAGDNLLVGSYHGEADGIYPGTAHLFDGSTGGLIRTFLNPTPAEDDHFGISVASVGDKVVVGADHDDGGGTNAGAAYLFDTATDDPPQTLTKPNPAGAESFGYSVATVGENIIVSAPRDWSHPYLNGVACVFDGSTGELLKTLQLEQATGWFGVSVAAVGSDILVGACYDDMDAPNAGAAYLFDDDTGDMLTLRNPEPDADDFFGVSVAGVGNNILVGAHYDDPGAANAGSVFLLQGIPEPTTLSLLALGGLALARRRKRAVSSVSSGFTIRNYPLCLNETQ